MSDLRELYEEVILDHNRNPRHFHSLEDHNRKAEGYNPVCGDEFTVYLKVQDDVIRDVGFEGVGCAISTASASLMTEALVGKTVPEAEQLFRCMHRLLTQESLDSSEDEKVDLGKLEVLAGVHEYPMRVKCATLAWHVMRAALQNSKETVCTE
jgi:nitrogen fixation NifU-like protein